MKVNEVRIRNVDAGALARIDQIASAKDMSRNEFLKGYIESLSVLAELKEQEEKYSNLVKTISEVIQVNTSMWESVMVLLNKR